MIFTVTVVAHSEVSRSNSLVEFEGMQLIALIMCVAVTVVLPEQSVATPSPILISKWLNLHWLTSGIIMIKKLNTCYIVYS